ncbi:MAG: HAMP domain-containing protein [Nitrospirae bacterium]|nr:HAMP domain-containing protein [Nitrospirota bacterium]
MGKKPNLPKVLPAPKRSLLVKFIISYSVMIGAVFFIGGGILFYHIQRVLDEELSRRLLGISEIVAATVPPSYLNKIHPGDEHSYLFNHLLELLKKIQAKSHVKDIFIFDRENRIIIDADEEVQIGQIYLFLKLDLTELDEVWKGKTASSILYKGDDGKFYKSGYAPIYDEEGHLVAAVGVEAGADFLEIVTTFKKNIFLPALLIFFFIIFVSWLISRSIINPIKQLVSAMDRLGQDQSYSKVPVTTRDEIGFLSNCFNQMIDNISEKDALLKELYHKEQVRANTFENYNKYILESISTGVIGVDRSLIITTFNSAAGRILEIPSLESRGKPCFSVLGGDENRLSQILMETVTGQKESGGIEIPFVTPKGTHKWLQVSSAPLYEKENEFVGGSVIFIDLTHVKKLQEEIKIKERLAALGEMSAQVAHEIRNPLGAIELNAEFLERKTEDEKSKVLTRNIIEEVKILNRIVTDFLAFAREPRLNKKKISLGPLLQKTADMACAAYQKIPVHTKISIPPDFPLIELDENEFKKALLNFLLNAIEAMPRGGDLALTVESRDGACAILISDTGSGIPDAVKTRIFNPFFTTKETGTGLGLAIAHKIIAGHYGTLSFTSQADKGTTFLITIPFSSGEKT